MDNITFKEVWSIFLGTASLVAKKWIGTNFVDVFRKRRVVDEYGDNVGAAMMPGGGWTQRHDGCKWTIAQQAS